MLGNKDNRNQDVVFGNVVEGHPISTGISMTMSSDMLRIAHRYILFNSAEVEPYIK